MENKLSRKEVWAARITLIALIAMAAYDLFRVGWSASKEYLPTYLFLALPTGLALYVSVVKKWPPVWLCMLYFISGVLVIRLIMHSGHYSY